MPAPLPVTTVPSSSSMAVAGPPVSAARSRAAGTVLRYLRGRTLLLITHRPEDLELLEITRQINI